MRRLLATQLLSLTLTLLLAFPAGATEWPMKYEGGTILSHQLNMIARRPQLEQPKET
ncbi:MAG: hypothetical protein HY238_08515, partial [Acidobacteria bacterium]|nr:hypothetical protein [Acidobacteriota bacterium]